MEHLLWVFLLTSLMTSAFEVAEDVNVNATVGGKCVLPCEGPEGRVYAFQWSESGKVLLRYRNGKPEGDQDEQFKGRVQLQDPDLKNGDLRLILKNVTLEDSGNYTCEGYVETTTARRSKRNTVEVITHVHLSVSEPSPKDTSVNDPPLTKRNTGGDFAHVQPFVSEPSPKDTSVNDPPLTERNTAAAVVVPVFIIFVLLGAGAVFWKRKEIKQWQALKRSPEEC